MASYARPGFACRHNIAYWTGVPYLGLGRSAATMTQNAQRRMRVKDGQVTDDLDSRQMVAEDLMLGMRMTAGVSDEHAARAAELLPEATTVLADLERQGLVEHEGGRWRPTERGCLRQRAVRRPVRSGRLTRALLVRLPSSFSIISACC